VVVALSSSEDGRDLNLARETLNFVRGMPAVARHNTGLRSQGWSIGQPEADRQQLGRDARGRSR